MGDNGKAIVTEEDAIRRALVKGLEGDLPYDRTLYVNHIRVLLKHTAESLIIVGKMLLVMKEKEQGYFMAAVEDEVGIPYKTAQRFMHAARKAASYSQIDFSKMDKLSNLYALLEAPEEDLKELQEKGIMAGRTIDELDDMSVKDMRNLIKKLKAKGEKIIGKQVSKLETKNSEMQAEIDRLEREIRSLDHLNTNSFRDTWKAAEDLFNEAMRLINNLDINAAFEDIKVRRLYLSKMDRMKQQMDGCNAYFREQIKL